MTNHAPVLGYDAPLFAAEVAAHQQAPEVPPDTIDLQAGNSALQVRSRGAYMTRLVLNDSRRPVSLLHCGPSLTVGKLTASHGMMPVGPSEEIGGQHGFPRWTDYTPALLDNQSEQFASVRLEAQTNDAPILYARTHVLSDGQAHINAQIHNRGGKPMRTSMGEHLYFNMPEGASVYDVRINDQSVDALMGQGVAEQVDAGRAYFWPHYAGAAVVELPDTPAFHLDARFDDANGIHNAAAAGLLLWQRARAEGQAPLPYLCIEPVFGYAGPEHPGANQRLVVPRGGRVAMSTSISM